DIMEKSAQVMMMGQIYSSTKQVVAWLGRGNHDSKIAVKFVGMLHKKLEEMRLRGLQPSLKPTLSLPNTRRTYISIKRLARKWGPFSNVLQNAWFERARVMQEVIMACTKIDSSVRVNPPILISFEKCTLGLDMLAEVLGTLETDNLLSELYYNKPSSEGTVLSSMPPPGLTAIKVFSHWWQYVSRNCPIQLYSALISAWGFKASNDRDKLYAVRGFCEQTNDAGFPLDYSASVEHIYKAWTTTLFERHDLYPTQLHMAGVGLPRFYTSLPSWVPDHSLKAHSSQLRPETSTDREGPYYRASGAANIQKFIIDRLSGSLRLRGIQIDTIEAVFLQPPVERGNRLWHHISTQWLWNLDMKQYMPLLRWLQSILEFLRASAVASEEAEKQAVQDLWQTIISNYDASETAPNSVFPEAFESWYWVLENLSGNFMDSLTAALALAQTGDMYNRITTFENIIFRSLGGRLVFGTSQKRLLGHGPAGLLAGDVVYILEGMCTPFLLREYTAYTEGSEDTDKRWKLVGVVKLGSIFKDCVLRLRLYGKPGYRLHVYDPKLQFIEGIIYAVASDAWTHSLALAGVTLLLF
ncbi:MAG: hypothetical protein Q9169_006239, partial [Polycauliona sp. 2 TL-2023]